MPQRRISFSNFNRRVVVAGGREQTGPNALRIASGVAPELTNSVMSRWGSTHLYNIASIQCYYWNNTRYQYDGSALYANGISIKTGFNGNRIAFNAMPPQPGLQDYLFVIGGGVTPFKISPTGTITNWGIVEPANSTTGINVAQDLIVIDTFNTDAANWTAVGVAKANEATIIAVNNANDSGGSLKLNPAANTWTITNNFSSTAQNLGQYSGGDLSLDTDVIQFWFYFDSLGGAASPPNLSTYLELDFDVNDGTFHKDWYSVVLEMIPAGSTNPQVQQNATISVRFNPGAWKQATIAKSQFTRNGTNLQFDWSCVQAMRFVGGNFVGNLYLDYLTQMGGCGLGAGPAVGNGGSEYDYYVVYRNLTTGSQSNPNSDPIKVFDVEVNQVKLSHIPVSSDTQVGARDIYRTQALTVPGGGLAFYLDTIYDNSTTTYTDKSSDFSIQESTTPWQASVAVPPANQAAGASYYIDAGNGYYFKLKTSGTTGSSPPTWKIPTTSWSANTPFLLNETTSQRKANGHFWKVTTAGTSGIVEPNWALAGPLTDGTVVWTDQGAQDTTDNSAVWTFQGINSTQVLSNTGLLFDNAPPQITYGWAIGPYQDSMIWTRDSAAGFQGYVYASPPGRPESVAQAYQVTSTDDPTQTVVIWDNRLWVWITSKVLIGSGSYPAFTFAPINDSLGTLAPYTVVPIKLMGIMYWAPDGIRIINYAGSTVIGFQELAPIFRDQPEENLPAWSEETGPVIAEEARNEVFFSDGTTLTLAFTYDGGGLAWRQPGQILTAIYYEHQTGEIQAAFGGSTYLYEDPGELTDGGTAIPFEIQSSGDYSDPASQFTTQRIYIAANLNVSAVPQTITPTLIIDGVSRTLPALPATAGRTTYELAPKMTGRLFDGINLTGSLTGRIEIFYLGADVWYGEQQEQG